MSKNTNENSASASATGVQIKEVGGYTDRFWYPRFWDGMTLFAWLRVLWKGGFRVAPVRWGMVLIVLILSFINSFFALLQWIFYGRRLREQQLVAPPIFIIGHWRSGTTLLHEYLIRDAQFTFADTYRCFAPSHFLVSDNLMRPLVAPLMPKRRPVDNMAAGFDRPQEDEFALTALGVPSPYLMVLFPNNLPRIDTDFLTLRDVTPRARTHWLDALETFLKAITIRSPKQIILKSPPHTARIRTLLERFPQAKFIHIHRDPQALFPSTYNLWMRLSQDEGCQRPRGEGLEEYVFATFEKMYAAFAEDVPLLSKTQFCEVGYDELTAQPMETLQRIYNELELSGFAQAREVLDAFAATQKHYRKNKFQLAAATAEAITTRWKFYSERYGYAAR